MRLVYATATSTITTVVLLALLMHGGRHWWIKQLLDFEICFPCNVYLPNSRRTEEAAAAEDQVRITRQFISRIAEWRLSAASGRSMVVGKSYTCIFSFFRVFFCCWFFSDYFFEYIEVEDEWGVILELYLGEQMRTEIMPPLHS